MKLLCPTCHAAVPAADINIQQMTAVCRECGSVFPFTREDLTSAKKKKRLTVSAPKGIVETQTPNGIELLLDGPQARGSAEWTVAIAMGFIAVITAVIAVAIVGNILSEGELAMLWLPLLFFAGAGVSAYVGGVSLWNGIRYSIDREALTVQHTPLWWTGNARLPLEQITGFRTRVSKEFERYYYLDALLEDGQIKEIGLMQEHHANYLRQELERRIVQDGAAPADAVDTHNELDEDDVVEISDDGELVLRERPRSVSGTE